MNSPIKCIKCGAPIEIDPYKEFAKCLYCGTTNIFDNGKLSSKSNKVIDKFRQYLLILKEKKVYIPLIAFSILFPIAIYKANYIDDFLVKECQIRTKLSNDGEFIAKKNYKKCLRNIKNEWSSTISKSCKNLEKYNKELPSIKSQTSNKYIYDDAEKEYKKCMNSEFDSDKWVWTKERYCYESKKAVLSTGEYNNQRLYDEWYFGFSSLVRRIANLRDNRGDNKKIEMNESGKFSQKKCNKSLRKVPHLIFGRNKRLFE